MDLDVDYRHISLSTCIDESSQESANNIVLEVHKTYKNDDFRLKGTKNEHNSILLMLRIADICDEVRNIRFFFYLETDTAFSVASEMIENLELENNDVAFIAELIDYLIMKLVPGWKASFYHYSNGELSQYGGFPTLGDSQTLISCPSGPSLASNPSELVLDQDNCSNFDITQREDSATSAKSYIFNVLGKATIEGKHNSSSNIVIEDTCMKSDNHIDSDVDGSFKESSWSTNELELGDMYFEGHKLHNTDCNARENIEMNEFSKNSNFMIPSLTNISSLTLTDKDIDLELKFEIDAIESHYQI